MKKLQYNSPVILSFFIISFLSLILSYITSNASTKLLFSVYHSSLTDPFTYFRFVGHILGHANFEHFISNMLLILVIGPTLEEKYGSINLLIGIILTALVSGILQFIFFPNTALLGASGIVFMFIMLSSLSGMKDGQIPLTLILVAALYLGQEIYSMIFIRDNVANLMHIIGGLCGTTFGFLLTKYSKKTNNSYSPF